MGNRSNINLVGNTTQGQNVGIGGEGVFKGKDVGNILQFKELSVTGTTMVITSDDENIYFSANTGGGGSSLWTQEGTCIRPATPNDDVLIDNQAEICWDGGISICGSSGATNNCFCINTNTGANLIVDGSQNWSIYGSAFQVFNTGATCSVYITPTGNITSNSANLTLRGGNTGGATPAHDVVICGGYNSSTNTGGDICLQAGQSASGSAGRIQLKSLPACVSETCTVFIDATGNLSTGVGGGGGGLSASSNGLNDNGTTVKLGGVLTETTTISGASTYDMCFHQLSSFNVCNLAGDVNMNASGGKINLIGCDANCVVVGLGLQLHGGTSSFVSMHNLPAKTSETDILYINAGGCIFSGATSGGGSISGAANGLSLTGGGTEIALGGDLTGTTTICASAQTFSINGVDGIGDGIWINSFGENYIGKTAGSGLCGGYTLYGDTSASMVAEDGVGGESVCMCFQGASGNVLWQFSNDFTITNNCANPKGLQYHTDYSDSFVDNSLVTKLYVSGLTSGSSASYWDRVGTCVIPATADDDVRLDCNAYLTWSGTTTCIVAFNSSGIAGNDYFCIKRGSTCISSGPTDQVTIGASYMSVWNRSSASILLNSTGSIITQCAHQNMCFVGGPSADGSKAGDACICGGQGSSTGNGGTVYIKGGTSVGGADGIICIVGATTATDDITATDFVLSSDESLKTCICSYIPSCVEVDYKEYVFCNKPGNKRYGVIAQELNETQPELVRCDGDGIMSVSYIDLLVREVAYLKNKVEELEKKIK